MPVSNMADLTQWLRDNLFRPSNRAFFANMLFEVFPGPVDIFWEFDKSFLSLSYGLLQVICCEGAQGERRLHRWPTAVG